MVGTSPARATCVARLEKGEGEGRGRGWGEGDREEEEAGVSAEGKRREWFNRGIRSLVGTYVSKFDMIYLRMSD